MCPSDLWSLAANSGWLSSTRLCAHRLWGVKTIRFTDSEWTRRLWCGRIRLRVPVGPVRPCPWTQSPSPSPESGSEAPHDMLHWHTILGDSQAQELGDTSTISNDILNWPNTLQLSQ